ncbi:hypothetical protein HJ01_02165 [Flavobacterium frigoris PS1]|uniref:Uncharacterized protein n=1 Tax=Flavobacterium frigoris (strain PS1) TaxID=1086011 RepID=H7FS16_FLAFP|nr:hypothetical protein HJ01_02165 [Flavobacterium frigoris PS1]
MFSVLKFIVKSEFLVLTCVRDGSGISRFRKQGFCRRFLIGNLAYSPPDFPGFFREIGNALK